MLLRGPSHYHPTKSRTHLGSWNTFVKLDTDPLKFFTRILIYVVNLFLVVGVLFIAKLL